MQCVQSPSLDGVHDLGKKSHWLEYESLKIRKSNYLVSHCPKIPGSDDH